jgi:hypothetical protein
MLLDKARGHSVAPYHAVLNVYAPPECMLPRTFIFSEGDVGQYAYSCISPSSKHGYPSYVDKSTCLEVENQLA